LKKYRCVIDSFSLYIINILKSDKSPVTGVKLKLVGSPQSKPQLNHEHPAQDASPATTIDKNNKYAVIFFIDVHNCAIVVVIGFDLPAQLKSEGKTQFAVG
jgi:hypothetical protein